MDATPRSEFVAESQRAAAVLGAPAEEFTRLRVDTYNAACKGAFRSVAEYLGNICEQLGLHPDEGQLDAAANVVTESLRRRIRSPRAGAMDLFAYLKLHRIKTGLITSCGPDVPAVWHDAPYARLIDVALFSCVEGVNKDDPRVFWLAVHRLRVRPEDCLYVADGYRGELASAVFLGMHAVQLRVPGEAVVSGRQRDPWDGAAVSSLAELVTLLEKGATRDTDSSLRSE